jgi:hypothetical protein
LSGRHCQWDQDVLVENELVNAVQIESAGCHSVQMVSILSLSSLLVKEFQLSAEVTDTRSTVQSANSVYRCIGEVFFGTCGRNLAVLLLALVVAFASVLLSGLCGSPWADWLVAAVAVVGGAVDAASFFFLLLLLRVSLDTMPEPEAPFYTTMIVVIIVALSGLLCLFLLFPSVGLFFCCMVLACAGIAGLVLLDVGLVRVDSANGVHSNLRLGPL